MIGIRGYHNQPLYVSIVILAMALDDEMRKSIAHGTSFVQIREELIERNSHATEPLSYVEPCHTTVTVMLIQRL